MLDVEFIDCALAMDGGSMYVKIIIDKIPYSLFLDWSFESRRVSRQWLYINDDLLRKRCDHESRIIELLNNVLKIDCDKLDSKSMSVRDVLISIVKKVKSKEYEL